MEQSRFKDYFSATAADYAVHRPTYPPALADCLAGLVESPRLAWDCGCGSGQLSRFLATRFEAVVATDASADQLARAPYHPNIDYRCARAEASGLATGCADLVVAAQAAHWFDLTAFYHEARRVGRPGAVIALVTYGIIRACADIDPLISDFYHRVVGVYWPAERRHVEAHYQSLPFPFAAVSVPSFTICKQWTASDLLGYIDTWSAVRAIKKVQGRAPIEAFRQQLLAVWGDASSPRQVQWPVTVRAGRL